MRVSLAGISAVAVITCLAVGGIGARPALAGSDPVVRPGHLQGWHITTNKTMSPLYDAADLNPSSAASFRFRTGPGRPPAGEGSLLMRVGDAANSTVAAVPPGMAGVPLDSVRSLSYDTYLTRASRYPMPVSFKIVVPSVALGHFTTLVYEPARQFSQMVMTHQWQTWRALDGSWWATGVTGPCSQARPCSWRQMKSLAGGDSHILTAYFELRDPGTDCALDMVIINGTVYNLEATRQPHPQSYPMLPLRHRPMLVPCRAAGYPERVAMTSTPC